MKNIRLAGLALAAFICLPSPPVFAQQKPPAEHKSDPAPNPDAVTLLDFKARVDAYIELRNKAAKDVPPLKETENAAMIKSLQEALGKRIAAARASAQPGDIFTPEIRTRFRKLLAPELKGEDGRDARAIVKDDSPASFPFKVNAPYPEGAPLPTVPANLLLNLPPLPKQVEYRIIDKHLILRDTEAHIVVDYIPNAIR
jgi:hypothetical protein